MGKKKKFDSILNTDDIRIILKFIDGEKTTKNGTRLEEMYDKIKDLDSQDPFVRYVKAFNTDAIQEYIKAKSDIRKLSNK